MNSSKINTGLNEAREIFFERQGVMHHNIVPGNMNSTAEIRATIKVARIFRCKYVVRLSKTFVFVRGGSSLLQRPADTMVQLEQRVMRVFKELLLMCVHFAVLRAGFQRFPDL